MTTMFVTGGAGFLGSHLCEHLLGAGHRVICLDNLDTGSLQNIEHIRDEDFFLFATPVRRTDAVPPSAPPRRSLRRALVREDIRTACADAGEGVEGRTGSRGKARSSDGLRLAGGDAPSRRSCRTASPAAGEDLRLWADWMTPVNERENGRRPAWRP